MSGFVADRNLAPWLVMSFKHNFKQDLGLKCQTPLRLKDCVEEVEGFLWMCEPENIVQLGRKAKPKFRVLPKAKN